MKTKKVVLVITDGADETEKMAAKITAALKGNQVSVKTASDFKGNDILPADSFFLGCEKQNPPSFAYLEDLFKHINLAGRTCGIFSPGSEKAVKYLAKLVKDCEAILSPDPGIFNEPAGRSSKSTNIEKWAQKVILKSL